MKYVDYLRNDIAFAKNTVKFIEKSLETRLNCINLVEQYQMLENVKQLNSFISIKEKELIKLESLN